MTREDEGKEASMAKVKVLVAEDDPEFAEALRVNLEAAGYQVASAADGLEALRLLDEQQPDLATVDLMMPVVSGFRLVTLLKRRRPSGPLPVIVVTGLDFEEAAEVALAGADDFVTKPADPRELVRRVGFALEKVTTAAR